MMNKRDDAYLSRKVEHSKSAVVSLILKYDLLNRRELQDAFHLTLLATGNKQSAAKLERGCWEVALCLSKAYLTGISTVVSDICLMSALSESTVKRQLRKLVSLGVMEKYTSESDRRRQFVVLKESYQNVLDGFVMECTEEFKELIWHQDITERKQAEAVLKESKEIYHAMIEQAADAMYLIEPNGGLLIDVNPRSCDTLGYTYDKLIRLSVSDIDPEYPIERVVKLYKKLAPGTQLIFESTHRRKDGSTFPVEVHVGLFEFRGKKQMLALVRNITKRKQAQTQLIQASKLASLGEMAAGAAHEINQPLNIIRMSAEAIADRLEEEKAPSTDFLKERLERIDSQTQRAADIIDRMRIFGCKPKEHATKVSPIEAIQGAVSFLREQLRLDGIELEFDIPNTCRSVMGDPIQLEQVVLNLLTNARDVIKESTRTATRGEDPDRIIVRVADDPETDAIRLTVEDTGGGIPENVLPQIFDLFFTTKEVGKGTGVGLSISYGIVTEMGGTITVENADDGAKFTITLPAMNEGPDQA